MYSIDMRGSLIHGLKWLTSYLNTNQHTQQTQYSEQYTIDIALFGKQRQRIMTILAALGRYHFGHKTKKKISQL